MYISVDLLFKGDPVIIRQFIITVKQERLAG